MAGIVEGGGTSLLVAGGVSGSKVAAAVREACIPLGAASPRVTRSEGEGASSAAVTDSGPELVGPGRFNAQTRLGATASRAVRAGPRSKISRTVAMSEV